MFLNRILFGSRNMWNLADARAKAVSNRLRGARLWVCTQSPGPVSRYMHETPIGVSKLPPYSVKITSLWILRFR